MCVVAGCHRPRLRGRHCCSHKKVADGFSQCSELVRCVSPALPSMLQTVTTLPDFLSHGSLDLAALVLAALVQEPTAVKRVVEIQFDSDETDDAIARQLARGLQATGGGRPGAT